MGTFAVIWCPTAPGGTIWFLNSQLLHWVQELAVNFAAVCCGRKKKTGTGMVDAVIPAQALKAALACTNRMSGT